MIGGFESHESVIQFIATIYVDDLVLCLKLKGNNNNNFREKLLDNAKLLNRFYIQNLDEYGRIIPKKSIEGEKIIKSIEGTYPSEKKEDLPKNFLCSKIYETSLIIDYLTTLNDILKEHNISIIQSQPSYYIDAKTLDFPYLQLPYVELIGDINTIPFMKAISNHNNLQDYYFYSSAEQKGEKIYTKLAIAQPYILGSFPIKLKKKPKKKSEDTLLLNNDLNSDYTLLNKHLNDEINIEKNKDNHKVDKGEKSLLNDYKFWITLIHSIDQIDKEFRRSRKREQESRSEIIEQESRSEIILDLSKFKPNDPELNIKEPWFILNEHWYDSWIYNEEDKIFLEITNKTLTNPLINGMPLSTLDVRYKKDLNLFVRNINYNQSE